MSTTTASASETTLSLPAAQWRPSTKGWAARIGVIATLAIGIIALITIVGEFQASRMQFAIIFAIVGLSMNLILGYGGQISLGHHAFFGIGAFTCAYFISVVGQDFLIGVLMATLSGGLAALLLGGVALRVTGLYLALVTLAYGALAEATIFQFPIFGGGAGLSAPKPFYAAGDISYAYLCLAVLGVVIYLDYRFVKSKAGRAVQAIRDSERVAASMGINVKNYKLLTFVMSGSLAGLAGGLFASHVGDVTAGSFTFFYALEFVLMTVVGGLGSRVGVIIGSIFFALLDKYFVGVFVAIFGTASEGGAVANAIKTPALLVGAFGSLLLIVTLIQFPGGIGQQIKPITAWLSGKKFDIHLMHEKAAVAAGPDVRP